VRAYDASSEEALHARNQLKDWAGEGFLDAGQYQAMEQETACDLRRTNIFLRLVLFLFSLLIGGATVGLFFAVFVSHPSDATAGIFLLIFAAIFYAAAELAVSRARLYRYGIEEALLTCSVGFLCAGMQLAFFHGVFSSGPHTGEFIVPIFGAMGALWIWRRFGLHYAFLGAMLCAVWLACDWTSIQTARHVIVAVLYAAGLLAVIAMGDRHRFTYVDVEYSVAEALLWLGIYVAINLQLSSVDLIPRWLAGHSISTDYPAPFYWSTWVLTWCIPPVILVRGVRTRDRLVMAVGAIAAVLTLATNKPYLGWPRHTWDPMLLGILLSGVALSLRRWLSRGPDGIRHGFTAGRPSGQDKQLMGVTSTAFGLAAPHSTAAPKTADFEFGGGDSGGAGASSDF